MLLIEKDILKFAIRRQVKILDDKCNQGLLNTEFNEEFEKSVRFLCLKFNMKELQINNILSDSFIHRSR